MAEQKHELGTAAWFDMVGALIKDSALQHGLPPDLNITIIERYSDGKELSRGFYQGLRLEIANGELSYRVGVRRDEEADFNVEVTTAASRLLNSLQSADPAYGAAYARFLETGEIRVTGVPFTPGKWLLSSHDPIVAITQQTIAPSLASS
jgi:hypothetical protein